MSADHPSPHDQAARARTPHLKILLISRALPAHVPGGLERHFEDLLLGLAAAGCEVHALVAPLPETERQRYAALGIQIHAARLAQPRRYTLRYLLGIGRAIERLLGEHTFDLIHAQEFALGFWRPPPGAPPLVLTVHGTITSETPLHPDVYGQLRGPAQKLKAWLHFGRRFLYAPAWRRALRGARCILVDSAFTMGELARLAPECRDKVHCVPLGVREPGTAPPSHAAARARLGWQGLQLLTTGRLEWQKGHELALEALAELRDRPWHYTIAGVGAYGAALERKIQRLGLEGRVTLAGWLGEEQKNLMLAGADLFLWPERTHPAFGLAGLEANLASTPVLATRRGAIPEVLGDHGNWLVERCEARALAEALAPLLADPARLTAARLTLRSAALERFAFEKMIAAVLEQYRAALRAEMARVDGGDRHSD